jgi:heme a synthase
MYVKILNKYNEHYYINIWISCVVSMLILLILIGGLTRLTDSGLSITEWKPISGFLLPFGRDAWELEFLKYKEIPEFTIINSTMELADFKIIYMWEWGHRFLARLVGFIFLLPFAYFAIKRKFNYKQLLSLSLALFLGILQAFVGWYMVQSGLTQGVDVSQYRLALHLAIPFLIIGILIFFLLYLNDASEKKQMNQKHFKLLGFSILILIYLQIILGAFVSGLKAGLSYNTWPLMSGKFIPNGLFIIEKWYLNFFENPLTVQFDHRMLAYCIFFIVFLNWCYLFLRYRRTTIERSALLLLSFITLQVIVGVFVLLFNVPIMLASLHQCGAIIIFIISLRHAYLMSSY